MPFFYPSFQSRDIILVLTAPSHSPHHWASSYGALIPHRLISHHTWGALYFLCHSCFFFFLWSNVYIFIKPSSYLRLGTLTCSKSHTFSSALLNHILALIYRPMSILQRSRLVWQEAFNLCLHVCWLCCLYFTGRMKAGRWDVRQTPAPQLTLVGTAICAHPFSSLLPSSPSSSCWIRMWVEWCPPLPWRLCIQVLNPSSSDHDLVSRNMVFAAVIGYVKIRSPRPG